MLEKYKDTQPVVYRLLVNAIKQDKLSHAYLFETNNNSNYLDIIMSFVKEIFCQNDSIDKVNICNRIDNGNFLELKVINPDGMQIKKEQLSELQEEFSKISIESDKKVYIINECEKMNAQAANSILKFLEEPVDNIIAILVTNNINKVLKTIVSRCQIISLNRDNYETSDSSLENLAKKLVNVYFCNNERNLTIYNDVISFIDYFEDNKSDTIVMIKNIWHDKIKDRQENILAIDIIINFYYDVFKYITCGQVCIFVNEMDLIKKIGYNTSEIILYRLNILLEVRKLLENNLNINLLIDYLIIQMGRR